MIAEQIGKRLPTEWEYEYAATNAGTTRFPWGTTPPAGDAFELQSLAQDSFDKTPTTPPIFGLFSNVREFVDSRFLPYPGTSMADSESLGHSGDFFTIRGGPSSKQSLESWLIYGSRLRSRHDPREWTPGIGLRCARSKSPRLSAEDF